MDVMIDLETFSTKYNASVLVVAGMKFDRYATVTQIIDPYNYDLDKFDTFYRRIDLNSCKELGLDVDDETISWWKNQNEHTKKEVFEEKDRVSISSALEDFTKWYGDCNCVWSHGSSFDCVILTEIYRRLKKSPPWHYCDIRDTRTLFDLAQVEIPCTNKHHAMGDCINQIYGVQQSMNTLFTISSSPKRPRTE